jgi:hypothetical protein
VIPQPELGYSRTWVGFSSSTRPSGVYKSGDSKVCNLSSCTTSRSSVTLSGSFSTVSYPIGENSDNTKAYKTGDVIQLTVSGVTTSNFWTPLVECRMNKFNTTGQKVGGVYFDSWTTGNVVFNYTVSISDLSGSWTVDYCGVFSDFTANNGWVFQSNNSGSSFKVSTGLLVQ